MKVYKISNGDIIKIIPFLNKDGSNSMIKNYWRISNGIGDIFDDTNKNIISRIKHKYKSQPALINQYLPLKCYYMSGIIDGEIVVMKLSFSLIENIITTLSNSKMDIRDNIHLYVRSTNKSIYGVTRQYLDYSDSEMLPYDGWIPPVSDNNSKEEWAAWIKENQPDFDSFISENGIIKNINKLLSIFPGCDIVGDFIKHNRNEKIKNIIE